MSSTCEKHILIKVFFNFLNLVCEFSKLSFCLANQIFWREGNKDEMNAQFPKRTIQCLHLWWNVCKCDPSSPMPVERIRWDYACKGLSGLIGSRYYYLIVVGTDWQVILVWAGFLIPSSCPFQRFSISALLRPKQALEVLYLCAQPEKSLPQAAGIVNKRRDPIEVVSPQNGARAKLAPQDRCVCNYRLPGGKERLQRHPEDPLPQICPHMCLRFWFFGFVFYFLFVWVFLLVSKNFFPIIYIVLRLTKIFFFPLNK